MSPNISFAIAATFMFMYTAELIGRGHMLRAAFMLVCTIVTASAVFP